MNDTIRRQDAIATAERMYDACDTGDITDYRDLMVEALKVLPKSRPECEGDKLIDADAFDERVRAAVGMVEDELTDDFKDGVRATLFILERMKAEAE